MQKTVTVGPAQQAQVIGTFDTDPNNPDSASIDSVVTDDAAGNPSTISFAPSRVVASVPVFVKGLIGLPA